MLNEITLTNFKRHENLTVSFGHGLTAVKAPNEGGKSSLLQAVAYALFGARALPDTLAETVTWGKPESALRVELSFTLHGTQYRIYRTKSSAEITYEGGIVTGQSETAKFIADLLGADAQMAGKLLIASQGDIQGALSGGARAAADLIERLADFQQIDHVIELIQTHLATGSSAAAQARVQRAEEALEELAARGGEADLKALGKEVEAAGQRLAQASQREAGAREVLDAAQGATNQLSALHAQASAAQTRIDERSGALAALDAAPVPDPGETPPAPPPQELAQEVQEAQGALREAEMFRTVQALNAATTAKWGAQGADNARYEGAEADARKELDQLRQSLAQAARAEKALVAEIARYEALILKGSCSACGMDLSDVQKVKEQNQALRVSIEKARRELETSKQRADADAGYVQALQEALSAHDMLRVRLSSSGIPTELATLGDAAIPADILWLGASAPGEPALQARLQAARDKLRAAQDAAAQHAQRRREYERWLQARESAARALEQARAALPADAPTREQVAKAYEALEAAKQALAGAEQEAAPLRICFNEAGQQYAQAREAQARAAERKASAEADIAEGREEIRRIAFNNALLKAVREARPLVTDRLWALVLGAVSTYFSEMRGAPSVVAKAAGGFTVDGHPVSALSGSTKDILGLAIRVALARTFLPALSLLVLDEPNAAMDDERTAQVLGFVAGCGFDQVLIVSHDEMTSDVANHVIELEAT